MFGQNTVGLDMQIYKNLQILIFFTMPIYITITRSQI